MMSVAAEQKILKLQAKLKLAASVDRFLSKGNSFFSTPSSSGGNS